MSNKNIGLFDSHAHYFDARFDNEYDGGADALLQNEVFPCGVSEIVNVATDPYNSLRCIAQAQKYENMYAAVGIHPSDCMSLSSDILAEVDKIRELAKDADTRRQNKIVAIGEIGLDYYWQPCDKEKQAAFFAAQLCLAEELGLPVIIHDREAHGDCFETVLRHPNVTGVFHSFSGSAEMARELTRRGWYISFSGVLTFKNARKVREVAQILPEELMLIETDAPYLSPEPFRGRLNHSARVEHTARTLAQIRGKSYDETVHITNINAKRLFGLL